MDFERRRRIPADAPRLLRRRTLVRLLVVLLACIAPLIPIAPRVVHAAAPVFQEFQDTSFGSPQGIVTGVGGGIE